MSTLTPPSIPDGFLTRWCDVLSESSESPPGAFLPSGLAVLSAAAGPRLVMRWGVVAEERMNLWVLNVGMSALARKTSGLAGLRRAVDWARAGDDDLVRAVAFSRLSDAGLVAALDVVGDDTKRAQVEENDITPKGQDPREIPEVVRPVPVSWIALFNEVAPVWMEDGPGWAMDAQRAMIQIYDGELSSTTRATAISRQECFVTAVGNIPPGVLRERTTLGMLASGWVGRWLVIPTPAPSELVSFPMPNGTDPLRPLRQDVDQLMKLARSKQRVVVNGLWTEKAIDLRHEWYRLHRERFEQLPVDDEYAVAAAELWGRLQATAVKVATLLAVSRQSDRINTLEKVSVRPEDVAWALEVVDNSIAYMTETLREAGADSQTAMGQAEGRVLRCLERAGARDEASSLTQTQVCEAAKGKRVSRGDVNRVLNELLQSGHVVIAEAGNSRRVWLS